MKKKLTLPWKKILRCAGFFVLCLCLLMLTSWIFLPRDDTDAAGMLYPDQRAFYSETEDTIDLFMLGNSSAYRGFSPMELWDSTGITSFVAGEPNETMSGANDMLDEVLSKQKPKVIFLETDMIFSGKESVSTSLMGIAKSMFPVLKYHNRWKKLSFQEIFEQNRATYHNYRKGQALSNNIGSYTRGEWMLQDGSSEEISTAVEADFEAFMDTCSENNIQVVLVDIPCALSWSMARHNAIEQLAEDHNLVFLDLNLDRASYGFDPAADFMDDKGEHLNCSGARKVTAYLAQWLTKNTSLKDHREEADYASWNDDYQQYYANCGLY